MFDIIAGIACFNIILICFKLMDKYGIDNLQAISVNYLTASMLSFFLTNRSYSLSEITHSGWFFYAIAVGVLFILVFNLLATAAQKIGMAISTVANKMSVIIPVTAAILLFGDVVTPLKILGIGLALAGVYFTSTSGSKLNFDKKYLWLVLFIFFGQGLADVFFNVAEKFYVDENDLGIFFCVLFAAAGSVGWILLTPQLLLKKSNLKLKNIFWGIGLGIPNFLTLLFFFRSLDNGVLESSQVYPIYNIGVVVLSALIGFFFFKEKLKFMNWIGILLSVIAIIAIGLGGN